MFLPMPSKPLLVLGLMSGTSADAIDVALTKISGAPPSLKSELLNHTTIPYPPRLRKEILRVAEQSPITAGDLSQLNFRLGNAYAEATLQACKRFRVAPKKIALLGSHGQTIFHQGPPIPYQGRLTASTLQIGEPAIIAAKTGITTVADFRPADIALGGQGAPLVPYADYLLYRHPKLGRISLNLGGIANITVLPAGCRPDQVFAFDTGPANMVIDALVSHFTNGRKRFDKSGHLAMGGRRIPPLMEELRRDPYLKLPPPKSTGREYYGHAYVQKVLALGRKYHARPNDLIRAATNFTANSIVYSIRRFVLPKHKMHQLIISGGGAHNAFACALIAAWLTPLGIKVLSSSELNVPTEAKEGYAFALMAYETCHHRPSNLPSATGACGPAILGKISYAPPR
jgi:anhydro-N-acetylmuramic acid kinase